VFADSDLFIAATASLGVTGRGGVVGSPLWPDRGAEQAGTTRTATAAMTGHNAVETTP
jgi:hypothetical protein